jgi:hypothetical protein
MADVVIMTPPEHKRSRTPRLSPEFDAKLVETIKEGKFGSDNEAVKVSTTAYQRMDAVRQRLADQDKTNPRLYRLKGDPKVQITHFITTNDAGEYVWMLGPTTAVPA